MHAIQTRPRKKRKLRIFPEKYWSCCRMDLERFLSGRRFNLLLVMVPVVGMMVAFVSPLALGFFTMPFLYSMYQAYKLTRPTREFPIWAF